MGSAVLNRLRVTVAAAVLSATLLALRGSAWPVWATAEQTGLLALSGLIGFIFGDNHFFRSLVILGPGRASLIASLAPVFTALLGVPVLGERLGSQAVAGMALTLGGVAWVMTDRERLGTPPHPEGSVYAGIRSGVYGALGQAAGYVISKLALSDGLDPLSASVIRIAAATAGVWILAVGGSSALRSLSALRDRKGALLMVSGAVSGPVLGVTLSLVALRHAEAGVAASITAVYPILTLLLASLFHRERVTVRVAAGAVISLAGVVVLFAR
jgi:drug/metabolite transporter (DMT)-like permease